MQPPGAEPTGKDEPEAAAGLRQPLAPAQDADCCGEQSSDDTVIMEWRQALNSLPIERRVLLIEQGIVHALALLPDADPPMGGPHGVDDDRIRCARDKIAAFEDCLRQITPDAVLAAVYDLFDEAGVSRVLSVADVSAVAE